MTRQMRESYRRGNVKQDAIKIAIDLIEQNGQQKLSIRQVAAKLGVAHRALYNHFANRDALLNAVATQGYDDLADTIEGAQTSKAFLSIYIDFALQRSNLFDVMTNRPHAKMSQTPLLQEAVHRVITKAWTLFGNETESSIENRKTVMGIYMLLHGGVSLHRQGILDVESTNSLIADLEEMAKRIGGQNHV